jgi:transcriptional regulator with XRE-family HTH domain
MSTAKKADIIPAENAAFFSRVEKLKLAKNWSWEETAGRLQTTRMRLHLIRRGKSGVSKRNLYRLEQLEIHEGLRPPGAKELIENLVSSFEAAKVDITASDIDRGYIELPIEYARGEPPKGYEKRIRLVRPDFKSAGKLIAELIVNEDYEVVVLSCIQPKKIANLEFLNMLTPFSYQALTETAMALVFGVGWRQKFGELPQKK